jgi:RNA polymerase sigma factor (sigma-70 family)
MRQVPSNPRFDGWDDEQLIAAAVAGDRDALVEFLSRHWGTLHRLASRYGRNDGQRSHGRDDVLSTVVRQVLAMVDRGEFTPTRAAEAHGLVRTILRRSLGRVFRRERVARSAAARRAASAPTMQSENEHRRVDQSELARIVAELTTDEYQLLLMRLDGKHFDVIAEALGCSIVTCRQRWRSLRIRLGLDSLGGG